MDTGEDAKTLPADVRDIMAQSFTELKNNRGDVLGTLVEKLQPFIKTRKSFDPNNHIEEIKGKIRDNFLSENEKSLLIKRQVGEESKKKNRIQQRIRDMFKTFKEFLRLHARSSVPSVFLESSQASSTQDSSQAASGITTSSNGSSYKSGDNQELEEDDSDDDDSDIDDENSIDVNSKEVRSMTGQKEKNTPTTSKVSLKRKKDSKSTASKRSALVRLFNQGDRELFNLFHSANPATNTSVSNMSNELEIGDDTALEESAVVELVLKGLLDIVDGTAVKESAVVVEDVLNDIPLGVEERLQSSSGAISTDEQFDIIIDPNKHPLLYEVTALS
jgi:hypothetical protein